LLAGVRLISGSKKEWPVYAAIRWSRPLALVVLRSQSKPSFGASRGIPQNANRYFSAASPD
jgi:hypothetical protein